MSDENNKPVSTQQLVRNIKTRVKDLSDLLHNQNETLRKRNMNLPNESLTQLNGLKARIDNVNRLIGSSMIELQSLRALADTAALINSTLDTDEVLNQVMDTVISLTGAERGYIVLKNRETNVLDDFRVARGMVQEVMGGGQTDDPANAKKQDFIISRTLVNRVAETGEPVLTDNATEDPRFAGQQSVVGAALRSILAVPLKVREDLIGVVYCDNRIMDGLFGPTERDLLADFANQAAVAIENARLFESARDQLQQITEIRDLINNVFNSIISGVVTINIDGLVLTCNSAAYDILNVENAVERPIQEVLPPIPEEFYGVLNHVFETGEEQLVEVDPEVAGKGVRHWNMIISPLRDASGQTYGIALVLDDLTEQKQRDAQIAEVKRYLPLALMENIGSIDVAGEERVISMIATDVRGFTSFSEKLQPEELMEIINKYLSVASDGINLYEGIVDKYMGDAVTGLFNTQLNPQEDHAVRAVRAAWSIMYDLTALHEVLPEDQRLFFGIGVHTSSAFLGNVGGSDRQEFSAMGEAQTISKILESNAEKGEILISQQTYDLVKDFFEVEERVPEKTKGVDIKIAYVVKGRKRGKSTGPLLLDPELADMLKDIGNNSD